MENKNMNYVEGSLINGKLTFPKVNGVTECARSGLWSAEFKKMYKEYRALHPSTGEKKATTKKAVVSPELQAHKAAILGLEDTDLRDKLLASLLTAVPGLKGDEDKVCEIFGTYCPSGEYTTTELLYRHADGSRLAPGAVFGDLVFEDPVVSTLAQLDDAINGLKDAGLIDGSIKVVRA